MTEVVATTGAIRSAKHWSNRHHQQTNTQLFTGWMPFQSPNQQCQGSEGINISFHGLAQPKLTCGSSIFVFDYFRLLDTLERAAMLLVSPLTPVAQKYRKKHVTKNQIYSSSI